MVALQRFGNGESPVASAKLNLIVDALTGAGNTPVNHGGVNDPLNYALTVRNQDVAGKAAIIYAPDGVTVLFQVTASGVLASATGGAASAIVSPTAAQTLTNKTFDGTSNVPVRIANTTLGASAANIDFTAIPQTFAHLLIAAYLRGDAAATSIGAQMQFNGDATAHYHSQRLLANAAAASAAETIAGTSGGIGSMTAASDAAVLFSTHLIFIPHYANTVGEKMAIALNFCPTSVTTGTLFTIVQGFDFDNGVAAVSRATLLPSAGNLVSGSRATLYGLPG